MIGSNAVRRCVIEKASKSSKKSAKAKPNEAPADSARDFAIAAAELAANTRCQDVIILDVSGVSPITDFLVIGTGSSARQMRSVIGELEELGIERKQTSLARTGTDGEAWMLVDFVNVVVHLFSTEARQFYDLENLWGDARRVEWSK